MSKIELLPKYEEKCGVGNGEAVSKIYLIDNEEISGIISPYSVAPLRILAHVMKQKGMNFEIIQNGMDPWNITKMIFDDKDANYVKVAL